MIFITAKFQVRPESAEQWPEISRAFTEATRPLADLQMSAAAKTLFGGKTEAEMGI